MDVDLVVIGAGPGGYTAAIKAAQLGMKTAIVEKDQALGGTCLNVGCIPSKALLSSTELYREAQHSFGAHGISADGLSMDVGAMMKRKDGVVRKMARGIDYLMNKNGIKRVLGLGCIAGPNEVEVDDGNKTQSLKAKRILIATGSRVAGLPFLEIDGATVLSSDHAIALGQAPESMGKDQNFPVSIEVQLLGGKEAGARSTANLCTPGTNVVMDKKLVTRHCTTSKSETYRGDRWVTVEVEVRGGEVIKHILDGKVVLQYDKPQLDPRDADAKKLIKGDKVLLESGYISLQSESHPVEFRKVELLPLK